MADISTTFIEWFPTLCSTRVTLLDFDMCANELYQWNFGLVWFDVYFKKCHKFTGCLFVDLCETDLDIFSVISCFANCNRLYDTVRIEHVDKWILKSQLGFFLLRSNSTLVILKELIMKQNIWMMHFLCISTISSRIFRKSGIITIKTF